MAKRKHHTKKHHTKRRRRHGMGAINVGGMVTNIAGVAVGAVAAGFITSKVLGKQSDTIKAIAAIGLGIATPMFLKSDLGKSLGSGMIAVGAIDLVKKSGIVGAIENMGDVEVHMAGVNDVPVISGYTDAAMSGDQAMAGDQTMAGFEDMPVISGYQD